LRSFYVQKEIVMKIKIMGDNGLHVTLDVTYRSWTPADDPWKASPIGMIGADRGLWKIIDFNSGYSVLFYGKDSSDHILILFNVSTKPRGNPFVKGASGGGEHSSVGGIMETNGAITWEVL
jgi:hypothetical protein